jgi:hypothetical protein
LKSPSAFLEKAPKNRGWRVGSGSNQRLAINATSMNKTDPIASSPSFVPSGADRLQQDTTEPGSIGADGIA